MILAIDIRVPLFAAVRPGRQRPTARAGVQGS